MDPTIRKQIAKRVAHSLKRQLARTADPIDLTEAAMDVVELEWDMHFEEAGIASIPESLREPGDEPVDVRALAESRISRPPLSRESIQPVPAPEKRLITMPGDAEFSAPPDVSDKPKRGVLSAMEFQRRPVTQAGANIPEREYWDYATLAEAITKNTPDKISFRGTREDGPVTLPAIRNVMCQIGQGNVVLTYRHPAVAENVSGNVTVDLIAKHAFSTYDREVDVDKAMDSIMRQLEGMYRWRPDSMQPVTGPEPGPLRLDMKTQPGAYHEERFEPGQHAGLSSDQIRQSALNRVSRDNDSLAPEGRRFNR